MGRAISQVTIHMRPFLVYRDKLFVPSESFIVNIYCGFQELSPKFVGMRLAGPAGEHDPIVLAQEFSWPPIQEALFKQLGWLPSSLVDRLDKIEAPLMHAHFGKSGAIALPLAEKLQIPLVVTFHGGDATKTTHVKQSVVPVYNRRRTALFQSARLIIAVSDFIRNRLISQGLSKDKVVVHYNGVNADLFQPEQKTQKLVFVGRFVEKKGIDTLIEAFTKNVDALKEWQIVLIGDGPLKPDVKKALADHHINATLTGWLDHSAVRAHVAEAMISVVPSRTAASGDSEGLPMVVMEAMMSGAAVIGSRHAGIPEAIQDGQTGFLFDEGDAQALATALRTMLTDKDQTLDFGRAGQTLARSKFNLMTQSRALEQRFLSI